MKNGSRFLFCGKLNRTKLEQKQQIWLVVKELLHEHDCVIVPNFGGFVCNREPARIDQVTHVITPPAKRIVFNQNLRTNDGLLAGKLSEKLHITYIEALKSIEETIEQVKNMLQDQKQFNVDTFGNFRLNAEANYVFLPDRYNNYLTSSYGLLPLEAAPVPGKTPKLAKARLFKDRKEVKKVRKPRSRVRNAGLKMLTIALFFMLGINGFILLRERHTAQDTGVSNSSISSWFDSVFSNRSTREEVAAIKAPEAKVVTPKPTITVAPVTVDTVTETTITSPSYNIDAIAAALGTADFSNRIPKSTEVVAIPAEPGNEVPVAKVPAATGDSTFYVIGGVFCKHRNAVRFCKQLQEKGFQAEMVLNGSINCNRVSYQKFSNRKEAEALMTTVHASENPNAWILAQHN